MKHEAMEQSLKAAPAVGGALYSTITLNEVVAAATLVYVVLQAAFLVYRWYWEHKEKRGKKDE